MKLTKKLSINFTDFDHQFGFGITGANFPEQFCVGIIIFRYWVYINWEK